MFQDSRQPGNAVLFLAATKICVSGQIHFCCKVNSTMSLNAIRTACLSGLAALLVGCATPPHEPESCERQALHAQACIRVQNLGEWEPLDESRLLLWSAQASRAHLLRLSRPITALPLTDDIDISDADLDQLICACGHDSVVATGRGPVLIVSIEYLSAKRTAELLEMRSSQGRPEAI